MPNESKSLPGVGWWGVGVLEKDGPMNVTNRQLKQLGKEEKC